MRKFVFPQESNLQPLDYRSTALPLELEKTPPHMLNFGYLNPATCLLYDCNNESIKIFLTFAGQSFIILIVLRASGLKASIASFSSRRSGGSSLGFRAGSL